MGCPRTPEPVKLFVALLTSRVELAVEIDRMLVARLGPIDVRSQVLDFGYTDYYEEEMGKNLKRYFLGFRDLITPDRLIETKLYTCGLEQSSLSEGGRRLANLDPGYLTPAKVVLATTKDYAHRLYLGSGIFGEVTLAYRDRLFQPLPWTYPDYRSGAYDAFFCELRTAYMRQLLEAKASRGRTP